MNANLNAVARMGSLVGLFVLALTQSASAAVLGYQSAVLEDNPVAYWRMSETSGTVMNDFSGFGRNGTYNANVSLGATGVGTPSDAAVLLNGTNAKATAPDDSAYDFLNYTIEAWVQFTGTITSDMRVVSHQGSAHWLMHTRQNSPGVVSLSAYSSLDGVSNFSAGPALNDGLFHHLAITRDTSADLISLYVDGNLVGTTAANNNTAYNIASNLDIGAYTSNQYFPGVIDEIALYNTALSAGRIEAHFIAGTFIQPVPEPSGILLLGSGILLMACRRRKLRHLAVRNS